MPTSSPQAPNFHLSVFTGSPADVAAGYDLRAVVAASAFENLWEKPTHQAFQETVKYAYSFTLKQIRPFASEPDTAPDMLTPVEELILVCGAIECLTNASPRQWKVASDQFEPKNSPMFLPFAKHTSRVNSVDLEEGKRLAEIALRKQTTDLLWGVGAILWARDLVVHGRAIAVGIDFSAPPRLMKVREGYGLLPRSGHLIGLSRIRMPDSQQRYILPQRIAKGLRNIGHPETTAEAVEAEFERIWANPIGAFVALQIGRMALVAGMTKGGGVAGSAAWKDMVIRIAPGLAGALGD